MIQKIKKLLQWNEGKENRSQAEQLLLKILFQSSNSLNQLSSILV